MERELGCCLAEALAGVDLALTAQRGLDQDDEFFLRVVVQLVVRAHAENPDGLTRPGDARGEALALPGKERRRGIPGPGRGDEEAAVHEEVAVSHEGGSPPVLAARLLPSVKLAALEIQQASRAALS